MRLSGRKYPSLTRHWTEGRRIALLVLVAANLLGYALQLALENYHPGSVAEYLGLSDRGVRSAYGWQFFTAAFLQAGPWHLLGNLLLLYVVGRDLESIVGEMHFIALYLAGTAAGEIGHLVAMPAETVLLGASGGVAAVLVAFATILPELELTSFAFFVLPLRIKARHLAYGGALLALVLLAVDRHGQVSHSACLGGGLAGWFYAHLLGFGRPSFLQRAIRQRRAHAERIERMSPQQFVAEEIDPLLEKISRDGIASLNRRERRLLALGSEKMTREPELH